MGKFVAVAFYFGGIHLPSFQAKFGCGLESAFPDAVHFVLERGLMAYDGETLQLTAAGVEAKPGVHALFYAPAVQEHLIKLCRGEQVRPRSGWRRVWQAEWAAVHQTSSVAVTNPLPRDMPPCAGRG